MSPRPLKVFLCHAHADRDPVPQGDDMRALYARLTTLAPGAHLPWRAVSGSAGEDGVDRYAWLDKEKPCGEPRRTILTGQDWELEIRKAVCER